MVSPSSAAALAARCTSPAHKVDRRKISPEALERLRRTVIELFAEGLFHEVGIRDVARRAKVGMPTIYKYFGGKDELIYACIEQDLRGLTEDLQTAVAGADPSDVRAQIQAFGLTFFGFYLTNRRIAEIVFLNVPARKWTVEPGFVQVEQLGLLAELLGKGQASGLVRTDVDPRTLVELLAGANGRYLVHLLTEHPHDFDPTREAEKIFAMLWPLVAAPQGTP